MNEYPILAPLVPLHTATGPEMVSVKTFLYTSRIIFVDKAITEDMASRYTNQTNNAVFSA